MRKISLLVLLMAIITPATISADIKERVKMFPEPTAGYKQVVIELPAKKNEQNLRVELFAGKNVQTDCNRHFMMGSINERELTGWGYSYYIVESDGNMASTRMACPDGKVKSEFVYMKTQMVRYNSRLPIVVYVPQGMDVKYRVWKAGKKLKEASFISETDAIISELNNPLVENKKWQLVELNGKVVEGAAETHYIEFNANEKRAQAKAGCNIINLPYEIKNEFQIRFGEGMSTMMACPDTLEDELKEVLSTVDNLSTDGKRLTLNKARMMPLAVFELVE